MESIKAVMEGEAQGRTVEFSMEEAITQHHGRPWHQLTDIEQEEALKDYARLLFTRQGDSISDGEMQVRLERGTFSRSETGEA